MDNRALFTAALGLQPPWEVVRVEFDPKGRRLDLHLDFPRGSRFPCPEGDETRCAVHDTQTKTWRHLDFFQHQAYLHARVPRVVCPGHGVHLVSVPWARPGSGFTLLFEALLMALLSQAPVNAVAKIVGEHDTRLWRVLHDYVEEARARASHQGVDQVGIDETSSRRGQDYVSLFVDLAGPRVLFATPGRDASTVERFAADLTIHGGDPGAVAEVCTDMSQAFVKGVTEHLPDAEITFDRYHLAQLLSAAVDAVRRAEAPGRPELKRTRYLWLKRAHRLSEHQRADLAWLRVRSRGLATARAYRWKLGFEAFYDVPAEEAGPTWSGGTRGPCGPAWSP